MDFRPKGTGCTAEVTDLRDYRTDHTAVARLLANMRPRQMHEQRLDSSVDLRSAFGPVRDQLHLGSSAAFACVGLIEYFLRRTLNDRRALSPGFVYKVTRACLHKRGDTGAGLRATLRAIARFGAPLEEYHAYDPEHFDDEPGHFTFHCGPLKQPLIYFRPVSARQSGGIILDAVKHYISAQIPLVFAFSVPDSIYTTGLVDYRPAASGQRDEMQAVVAVGYDDNFSGPKGGPLYSPPGAVLFRSSWGRSWGEDGYGWLPYHFIKRNLATDYWTMLHYDWVQHEELFHPFLFEKTFSFESEVD